ncbi:MAG: hypothetical protein AAGA58_06125 [Verrucomicrobiota bacterium]
MVAGVGIGAERVLEDVFLSVIVRVCRSVGVAGRRTAKVSDLPLLKGTGGQSSRRERIADDYTLSR